MRELALFAGAGGGILGGKLLGWTTVCGVEIEPDQRGTLAARQNDGCLKPFPVWDDVRTFDGTRWRDRVNVVSGGFPCQDIAVGSSTKTGIDGERSGLWRDQARIIREVEPDFAFVENSANLVIRGLERVLGDLAAMGFDARWGVFSAADVGARHERQRLFIVAHNHKKLGHARPRSIQQFREPPRLTGYYGIHASNNRSDWLALANSLARNDNDLAGRVESTQALGNGQVPAVVRLAWETLRP